MTMRDVANEYFAMKKASEQPTGEPPVRFSELVSWRIVDTPCRPRRWKLVAATVREDNSWTNYFENYSDAQKEQARRMARDNGEPVNDKLTDGSAKNQ